MAAGLTLCEQGYEVGYEEGRKSKAVALFRILLRSRFDELSFHDDLVLIEEASLVRIPANLISRSGRL